MLLFCCLCGFFCWVVTDGLKHYINRQDKWDFFLKIWKHKQTYGVGVGEPNKINVMIKRWNCFFFFVLGFSCGFSSCFFSLLLLLNCWVIRLWSEHSEVLNRNIGDGSSWLPVSAYSPIRASGTTRFLEKRGMNQSVCSAFAVLDAGSVTLSGCQILRIGQVDAVEAATARLPPPAAFEHGSAVEARPVVIPAIIDVN